MYISNATEHRAKHRNRLWVAIAIVGGVGVLLLVPEGGLLRPAVNLHETVITPHEFDQIEPGMSYEECVAIIGEEGAPFGESTVSGAPGSEREWISYVWRNSPNSRAEISFQFGRVSRKRAYGLE